MNKPNASHSHTLRRARALFPTAALAAATLLLAGCGTDAHRIDSGGKETITSLDRVDIQDFTFAANSLLASLYEHPSFQRLSANGNVPVLAFSRVYNDTTDQFDVDLLVQKIRTAITNSGKAEVSALVGTTQDSLTKESNRSNSFASGDGSATNSTPDLVLTGKILQVNARAGSTRQVTYIFQLNLNNTKRGTTLWSGEKEITKQGTRAAVGG